MAAPRAVIMGARTLVPAVEMASDDDHFIRVLRPSEFSYHIGRLGIRKRLTPELQLQAKALFRGEQTIEEIRPQRAHGRRRHLRDAVVVSHRSCVGNVIEARRHRPYECRDSPRSRRLDCPLAPLVDSAAIGLECAHFASVNRAIEDYDFTPRTVTKRLQLVQ